MEVIEKEVIHGIANFEQCQFFFIWFCISPLKMKRKVAGAVQKCFCCYLFFKLWEMTTDWVWHTLHGISRITCPSRLAVLISKVPVWYRERQVFIKKSVIEWLKGGKISCLLKSLKYTVVKHKRQHFPKWLMNLISPISSWQWIFHRYWS